MTACMHTWSPVHYWPRGVPLCCAATCLELIRSFGFKEADMKLLLEDGPDRSTYPTKANIENVRCATVQCSLQSATCNLQSA